MSRGFCILYHTLGIVDRLMGYHTMDNMDKGKYFAYPAVYCIYSNSHLLGERCMADHRDARPFLDYPFLPPWLYADIIFFIYNCQVMIYYNYIL